MDNIIILLFYVTLFIGLGIIAAGIVWIFKKFNIDILRWF